MDFNLLEMHNMVLILMRNFAEKEVRPKVKELEERGEFPKELAQKLGEMGFMGIFVPEQYGGEGLDVLSYVIAEEELARVWASLGLIMSANNSLSSAPILKFGTEEQKQKYLVDLARGTKLGCYALTEPDAGSDVARIKTTAKFENGQWALNGVKRFITNASQAQTCVLIAKTSENETARKNRKHLSAFIVETSDPGFKVVKIEKKMGLHCSPTCEIVLEDCKVPAENILGLVGDGWQIAMHTLNGGRINIAAQSVGISQAAYEEALSYAKERKMFGAKLFDLQSARFKLAQMKIAIDASRLLTQKAAWLKDNNANEHEVALAAAEAKYFASESAQLVTYDALQIFGGSGYMQETPVERYFRDARALTIYEGASEIQLEIISRRLS